MRNVYTKAHLKFLRKGYASMTVQDLAKAFNKKFGAEKTVTAIKAALGNHGIKCGRNPGELLMPCRLYSPKQQKFLRKNHVGRSRAELAALYNKRFGTNITVKQIKTYTGNRGLNSGLTGRFEKGQISWNKGVKGYMGPNATSFKKGDMPVNLRPLYAERITKDGYIEIKVPERNPHTGCPTRFKLKHVYIWEKKHGKVPAGMALIFKDGNKLHCRLGNLMLVSRFELLRLNQHRYKDMPGELKPSVLALAKLEVKTFEVQRKEA